MSEEKRQTIFLTHSKFITLRELSLSQPKSTCKLCFFVTIKLENPMKEKEYKISQVPLSLVKGNYYLVTYEREL